MLNFNQYADVTHVFVSFFFLIVPVSEVILSPYAKVEVIESTEVTFICSAKRSRPASNITWHRKNIVVSETSSTIEPNGLLFDVESVFNTSFQKGENEATIYCTANIGEVQQKRSKDAVINVICEYIFLKKCEFSLSFFNSLTTH